MGNITVQEEEKEPEGLRSEGKPLHPESEMKTFVY